MSTIYWYGKLAPQYIIILYNNIYHQNGGKSSHCLSQFYKRLALYIIYTYNTCILFSDVPRVGPHVVTWVIRPLLRRPHGGTGAVGGGERRLPRHSGLHLRLRHPAGGPLRLQVDSNLATVSVCQ